MKTTTLLAWLLIVVGVIFSYRNFVNPSPTPDPDPAPMHVSDVYLVHESRDNEPGLARIIAASGWKKTLDDRGIEWEINDDDVLFKRKPLVVDAARKAGLPSLVAVGTDGALATAPVPADVSGMNTYAGGLVR